MEVVAELRLRPSCSLWRVGSAWTWSSRRRHDQRLGAAISGNCYSGPKLVPVVAVSVDGKRIDVYGRSVTRAAKSKVWPARSGRPSPGVSAASWRYAVTEIGSWTTAEGTVPATLDFEWAGRRCTGAAGLGSDAATGALTGALDRRGRGPYGALIGAVRRSVRSGGVAGEARAGTGGPDPRRRPTTPPAAGEPHHLAPASAPSPLRHRGPRAAPARHRGLQQLAAILPVLMQAAAASGGPRRSQRQSRSS